MSRNTPLYDTDFYAWTQAQAALLRQGRLEQLDLENLIEEVDSMGRSERHALLSQLTRLLAHLLKWGYSTPGPLRDQDLAGWEDSISWARLEIGLLIEQSPSLKAYPAESLDKAYRLARQRLRSLRHPMIDPKRFPEACPWSIDQVLDPDFFPAD